MIKHSLGREQNKEVRNYSPKTPADRETYHVDVMQGDSITFWDVGIRIDIVSLFHRGIGKNRKTDVYYDLLSSGRFIPNREMLYKKGGALLHTERGDIKILNLGHKRCGDRAFLRIEMPQGLSYILKHLKNRKAYVNEDSLSSKIVG